MPWILLTVAGLFEVAWARLLPHTDGLTRALPTAAFAVTLSASMYLLAVASRSIPVATAYAVWVGIGAAGTSLVDIVGDGRPSPQRLLALTALIGAIIAVKLTSTNT